MAGFFLSEVLETAAALFIVWCGLSCMRMAYELLKRL